MKSESPKFFCENCGKEVKRNAPLCPHCGRFFASVRCPSCNYLGSASQFTNGCPKCGYALNKHKRNEKKEKHSIFQKKEKIKAYDDALPKWIYILIFAIITTLIILIWWK